MTSIELSVSSLERFKDGARNALSPLMATLGSLDDEDLRLPSLLPGWSKAHVATHVARNADSYVRMIEAARAGVVTEQYAGGWEGRAAEIEAGVERSAGVIAADVMDSSLALFDLWDRLPATAWEMTVHTNSGPKPMWRLTWGRWRELDIHHVDLGESYRPSDWPRDFVATLLTEVVGTVPARMSHREPLRLESGERVLLEETGGAAPLVVAGPQHALLAWAIGRPMVAQGTQATRNGDPVELPELEAWA